jgi:dTMP kinase
MGYFIAIEGPNGSGKSTFASLLSSRLSANPTHLTKTHLTKEPSNTPLGNLVRNAEESLAGESLALAVAADRHHHYHREIASALSCDATVITDRYIASSLALQSLDGVKMEYTYQINALVPPPDCSFYLDVDVATLGLRLSARTSLSRFERESSRRDERAAFERAFAFLESKGWNQHWIHATGLDCQGVVDAAIALLPSGQA